ncbi:osmoprotectant transport system permease protein [Branchiibius hedensis]|uniref:Osmoprotectant transport system permease protein n=1 Tax=Branchiibius hedensis TaxID=672460 RepID=A0A2Y8ZSF7_9MICO|nr:ABC transporter permease [Branchiibius hedensis]PWJ25573.1 osmoprotectant transport system permease protein [Branchiibius hedensis]SSA34386.1 osmoprotectant transport system permease protein [Branchiibius hedensis]
MFSYFHDHFAEVMTELWAHTWLSTVPVVIGLLLALPLGWIARRYSFTYPPIMTVTGLLYTIPSIALFVLIPPLLGLDPLTPLQVPIALTIYSVALLVRVVADGLGSVSETTTNAATAIGYTGPRRFFAVDLPIAVPVISAGVRVAVVSNVSIVAVAGTIGMTNLGSLFDQGYQLSVNGPYYPPILLGLVLCILLALVLDALVVLITRLLTPWRRGADSAIGAPA